MCRYVKNMGNCCKKRSKRNVVLLLVGLDNAGKTVTVKGLAGENLENSIPTVGFSTIHLKYLNADVTIYDLGGGKDIRGIWHRYFVDAHGVIFVIDASDHLRLNEAKHVFQDLLSHKKISGKPVLLLANKQDYSDALDEIDIAERLQLEDIVNEQKCPTLIETCTATDMNKNSKIDPGIKNGYRWLLNCILRDYAQLNERVQRDIDQQKYIEKQNREKLKMSLQNNTEETEFVSIPLNDPFKPINEVLHQSNETMSENHSSIFVIHTNELMASSINDDIFIHRPNTSALTTPSNSPININYSLQRPKSALDGVKKQLEKTSRRNSIFSISSNKTAPVTLFTPKTDSPVENHEEKRASIHKMSTLSDLPAIGSNKVAPVTSHNSTPVENGFSHMKILTVTDLPNTLDDMTVENHNVFVKKIKNNSPKKSVEWNNRPLKRANAVQNDFDLIVKDIS